VIERSNHLMNLIWWSWVIFILAGSSALILRAKPSPDLKRRVLRNFLVVLA